MKLKYIGSDSCCGLKNGVVYECHVQDIIDEYGISFIQLRVIEFPKHIIILYTSFDTLLQNWEELK